MPLQSRNILFSSLLGLTVILAGTFGYRYIEGWTFLDGLYMTVITVATIGYGEIRPLTPLGRIFTIFLIVFGVGTAAYLIGQITRVMVEGSIQKVLGRRMLESQIKKARNHYVLCGYGRIGQTIAQEISARGMSLVVIENDPEVLDRLDRAGLLYIKGDASDEDILTAAGIKNALGLISAVSSDADNLFIVLTARGLNPNLFIVSRASQERNTRKLMGVGADRVVSPNLIGARKMAQTVLRPAVSDFLESTVHGDNKMALVMEEMLVTPDSKLKEVTLLNSHIRQDLDLIVVAIKKRDGQMLFNPSAQALVQEGDVLIAVGLRDNMDKLAKILGADQQTPPSYTRG